MRKIWILGACLLLCAAPLTACGDGESSEKTVVGQARAELNQHDCNDIARRMVAAASAALTDLASGDTDISTLDQSHEITVSAFLAAQSNADSTLTKLLAGMKAYDTDLEKANFKRLALKIEGGVCTAAAVEFGESTPYVYGTYPNAAEEGAYTDTTDVMYVLGKAAG